MKCKICGATCRCKKASPGICCSCHQHRGAAARLFPTAPTMTEALWRFRVLHYSQLELENDAPLPAS